MGANDYLLQEMESEFQNNTSLLGLQANKLVDSVAPYLTVTNASVRDYLNTDSAKMFENMAFFRLVSCMTEKVENAALYLNERMAKLFTAIHSLNTPIAYGVVSYAGTTNVVIGVDRKDNKTIIKSILEGLLTGLEITDYTVDFTDRNTTARTSGIISAVPIIKSDEGKQWFDISTLMRSLNNRNYTVLFYGIPYTAEQVQQKYSSILDVRDECFSVSKRNISLQETLNEAQTKTETQGATRRGVLREAFQQARHKKFDGKSLIDSLVDGGVRSSSVSLTSTSTDTMNKGIAFDVQNGVAMELMGLCERAIERLKEGQGTGLWASVAAYSAEDDITATILRSCLHGELSKPATDILPLVDLTFELKGKEQILVPSQNALNPLYAPITSAELGTICTPPFESVPDFELKQGKVYPMIASSNDGVVIGRVSDGHRPLTNMGFSLSEADLSKHTFVCGITGSGKTTTVKGILKNCKKPFLVIESAKKEYRNMELPEDRGDLTVYTLGKPEINCLRFNPFYIQCGVNLQTHIDFLKDLFNASFSFYGPMPYILEKCLFNIYRKKGWNLILGCHPYLVNLENTTKLFESEYMKSQYALKAHRFLFPTMQDLKDEVERYIQEEMNYEGEVAGNIRTAITARLDSLCIGSKGFMFNTNAAIDMDELMQANVVFELEGLADDSDKAFCVGLLIIFINEYRQVFKEEHMNEKLGLQHLLVIEEAHRLLKNVETGRLSETMGNPQGKAVEHFTNMIAEMRAYGQGVIVAEQIPSKLAPDVIKNSSNKIIQRVVSADDQSLIANTIGMKTEDAVYLGSLRTGVALCHREGMSLPVYVSINHNLSNYYVSDGDILGGRIDSLFQAINYAVVKESVGPLIETLSLKTLNCILAQDDMAVVYAIKESKRQMSSAVVKHGVTLIPHGDSQDIYGRYLAEGILNYFIHGVYSLGALISDDLIQAVTKLCTLELPELIDNVRTLLEKAYMRKSKNHCILIISELLKDKYIPSVSLELSIKQYFFEAPESLIEEMANAVRGRWRK